jgi:hypothetical protein
MTYRSSPPLACTVVLSLLMVGTAAEVSAVTASFPNAAQDTLVGTVRSVDYQTNTVEVLTGVGLAITIERVHVDPAVPVTIDGQSRPLADLRRGQVVLVTYRTTEDGKVATSLEVVPIRGARGAP